MTAGLTAALVVQTVSAKDRAACGDRPGWVCLTLLHATHNSGLASFADTWLATPVKILFILLVAVLVRVVLNRLVTRLVRRTAAGSIPVALRPRGRAGEKLLDVVEASPLLTERRRQRAETVGSVLRSLVTFAVFGIAFVTALGELGINLAPIVASAGVVGVAVGFGAQNLVRDFLTGIFMILEDQYGVGDVIDAGPASGTVEAVGLRTTRLRDVNGVVWHIRNGEIDRVGNKSQQWSRAVIDVPISYSTDVPEARELIQQAADEVWHDPRYADVVLEEPEVWGVEALDPDKLAIRVVVKTAPLQQWTVARALRERIVLDFESTGAAPQVASPGLVARARETRDGQHGDEGHDNRRGQ